VERLKTYCFNENDEIEIYNLGISGDNTNNLIERFELECNAREPEIIIFSIGVNDSTISIGTDNIPVSFEKFEENIYRLIELSKKFTDKIVFLGLKQADDSKTMLVPWHNTISYSNKNIKKYDDKLKEICDEKNVDYVYVFDLLSKENLEDGLHPNSKGHEKLFNLVKEFLMNNKLI